MTDVRLGVLDHITYACCPEIETLVHVYHGPVHYKDESGRIVTQKDFAQPNDGVKPCFTKKTCFEFQSEYRFAVSTLGEPVERTHYITSPELREFCRELLM